MPTAASSDRHAAEDQHQRHAELLASDRARDQIGDQLELDRDLRIEPPHLVADRRLRAAPTSLGDVATTIVCRRNGSCVNGE